MFYPRMGLKWVKNGIEMGEEGVEKYLNYGICRILFFFSVGKKKRLLSGLKIGIRQKNGLKFKCPPILL